jgi:rSAM/selenodomain-associated transferase 1
MAGPAVAVMTKAPRPGRVKTRLARTLGTGATAALYAAFIGDLDERLAALGVPALWFYWPPGPTSGIELAHAAGVFPQRGADLGDRMEAAFAQAFALGYGPVVMVGADVPHVPLEWIAQAIDGLASGTEVVVGPAADGGYYLVGLSRPVSEPFRGVPWGTSSVYATTLERIATAGLRMDTLPAWFDIDERHDLDRLRTCLAEDRLLELPRTTAALVAAGLAPVEEGDHG